MTQKEMFEKIILNFIDAYLDLNEGINSAVITQKFGIHRTRASTIMGIYKEENRSLKYSFERKMYVKGYFFKKVYLIDESSFNYLNAIDSVFRYDNR